MNLDKFSRWTQHLINIFQVKTKSPFAVMSLYMNKHKPKTWKGSFAMPATTCSKIRQLHVCLWRENNISRFGYLIEVKMESFWFNSTNLTVMEERIKERCWKRLQKFLYGKHLELGETKWRQYHDAEMCLQSRFKLSYVHFVVIFKKGDFCVFNAVFV